MEHRKRLYCLTRPAIKPTTIIIITFISLLFLFYYNYTEEISHLIMDNSYASRSLSSSIVECLEPRIEFKISNQFLSEQAPKIQNEMPYTSKKKLVLLWTKFFGKEYSDDYHFFKPGNETFVSHMCPVNKCLVTRDSAQIKVADALIFHQFDFSFNHLPTYRGANQLWIFYNLESPRRNIQLQNWKKMNGLFNWTMSYREDADVKAKYGEVCRLRKSKQLSYQKHYLENKTREVAWFVSNCKTSSNRESYVDELSLYISVDIYGKCGPKKCSRTRSRHCYEDILKNYKFYLSFENSICKDYATEKIFNILDNDIVPVVMGGADYERILPPNSYINALDYPNPRKLAEHLRNVGGNHHLYNSYFQWKGKYKTYLYPWMCELCEKLHAAESSTSPAIINNMEELWHDKAQCKTWWNGSYKSTNLFL